MRGLCFVALLAACDSGVVIEVRPAPGTQPATVDLFLGLSECYDKDRNQACPGIKPPGDHAGPLPGTVYERDDNQKYTANTDGSGVATFKIQGSDAGQFLPMIVAVSEGTAAGFMKNVDLTESGRYVIQMQPADDVLGPKQLPRGTYYADIWESEIGQCVGFEIWNETNPQPDRWFVVSKDDPDCDGRVDVGDLECNKYAHDGSSSPDPNQISCLDEFSFGPSSTQCRLGGPACVDGQPMGTVGCGASEYCIPNALCIACDQFPETSDGVRDCLKRDGFTVMPNVRCGLPFRSTNNGSATSCTSGPSYFEVDLSPAIGVGCQGFDLVVIPADNTKPLDFKSSIEIQTMNPINSTAHKLTVTASHLGSCKLKMEFHGDRAEPSELPNTYLRIGYGALGGATRYLLMPLELVSIQDGCMKMFTCGPQGWSPSTDLLRCAR